MTTPFIVVHGGAGTVAEDLRDGAVTGTKAAAAAGQAVLLAGGSAEAAVIAAVRALEDDPGFNAGRGACMNADGVFEADAAIMRSRDLRSGAVAGVREVRDTILLAALVMNETRHCLLVGDNAARFARERGVGQFGREEVWTAKAEAHFTAIRAGQRLDNRADTVGAVALDARGELCAGGSTGGVLYKLPGRVGDTPMVGSGLYAHPELGACATTGLGEAILTHVLAYAALQRVRGAASDAVTPLAASLVGDVSARWEGAAVGLVLLRPDGTPAIVHASEHMSWALARGDAPVTGGLSA
ncbi:isoaspartyl peptidase/L-asparaginase [Nannocystis bainbridge]|uniref:Isoaspartyl peptidase/L-asparaginase n=1 Tax=Nannocystis bainbridge TaxID=2995303 RepID=A0ABT5E1V9_9BACT|nr:isoaspartyl peptidase/L-asparaginase [Nannocystis bainbridge]MDC0719864.1 isoaspartyl peptidase/L-asparaginase [Nannocystis bainbridge]